MLNNQAVFIIMIVLSVAVLACILKMIINQAKGNLSINQSARVIAIVKGYVFIIILVKIIDSVIKFL